MELLIGCGSNRKRKLTVGDKPDWTELVTLDMNDDHKPDIVWDLTKRPLPFADGIFDEIHAYDVLEHLGQQGDYKSFFDEFSEWYRILKPGGFLAGISPKWDGQWAWGDPGHTRVISEASFVYLQQPAYTEQVGNTAMTDYRFCYKADFQPVFYDYLDDVVFYYALQAIKPSRITL
jgi:SAM-dependent methyltransferase